MRQTTNNADAEQQLSQITALDDLRGLARDELLDAHRQAWRWIAQSGTWLEAPTRCAVAKEARNAAGCRLCRQRKDALSPLSVSGTHDDLGLLGDVEVDAIHRIATDSGRLSETWLQGLFDGGLSDGAYIEITGIVAMTMMMDAFARAVGAPAADVPSAIDVNVDRAPSHYRPPGARKATAWVPVVQMDDVVESDGALYGGSAGGVHQALSLVPDSKRAFWALGEPHYIPMTEIRNAQTKARAISRAQIEILAGRTSALHQCVY